MLIFFHSSDPIKTGTSLVLFDVFMLLKTIPAISKEENLNADPDPAFYFDSDPVL